ncbi:uncharacterized protein BYT42DRAFT_557425 [Radiomyces spectabilis]|uniref:uncharacterized protein n=1 Tax=Radiomyces spectabilis TaxID=64574 RepID=UPI00221E78CB|nr:uncharacterized protein BYT42DRAFT_557425 [Radiomyces spectabilis]KAI8391600.1 hypothetical protein BYT42DRAFT_557425 [Radiomyces spectabilis]
MIPFFPFLHGIAMHLSKLAEPAQSRQTMASVSANTKPELCRIWLQTSIKMIIRYPIVKLFQPFGKITFLELMIHRTGPKKGQSRGFCFLEFAKKEDALRASAKLHGHVVKGRPLVVSFAHHTAEQDEQRGPGSATTAHRPNAFSILRTQKMANASTDAKIQAIERKLALLQKSPSSPSSPSSYSAKPSSSSQFSIRSTLSTEANTANKPKDPPVTKHRYKPY